MAQSTTNLGKIHVFPSETLYNQFKDIIADNDLALLKDDGAYIVAALLEQNGYVKFSNGLILQWGNSWVTNEEGWVNFPIKFNKICFTCIPIYTDYGDSPTYTSAGALSDKDVTGFNFRTAYNGITLSYIAIGM